MDIGAALGTCDVSSSNPRRTDDAIGRQEVKRFRLSGCEMISGGPQRGCIELMDTCWEKLSCGLALQKAAQWLQLGCSIGERNRTKQNKTNDVPLRQTIL